MTAIAAVMFAWVISLAGCAGTPSIEASRPALEDLGAIGVISFSKIPDVQVRELPPRGVAEGAVFGAAAGGVVGALEYSLLLIPYFPLIPACIATTSALGMGAGAMSAQQPAIVDTAQLSFKRLESDANWQTVLRQRVISIVESQERLRLVDLGELPVAKSQHKEEFDMRSIFGGAA
jgi:hypothetical protein